MQNGLLLLTLTLVTALLAGCAEGAVDTDGNATPPAAISEAAAAALFTQAAGEMPDRYGVKMSATKNGTELMAGDAVFDEPAQTTYFAMSFDPSLVEEASSGMDAEAFSQLGVIAVYASPAGNAILVNGSVMVTPPDEDSPFTSAAEEQDGFQALAQPDQMLLDFSDENITVHSVTPTTLRGKAAFEVEATLADEGGETQNITVWLFQDPARVGRFEMTTPVENGDDDPFAGAVMAVDLLYDDEIELDVPPGLVRALGLRWESNRASFGGFGGYGGEEEGPEVWTFQSSGGIALSEVVAEVTTSSSFGEPAEPEWTMPLSDGSKAQDGITLTFADVDGDGKLSVNDTLTIERAEDAAGTVMLQDTVSGYRIVPGAGFLYAAFALVGLAWVARRR